MKRMCSLALALLALGPAPAIAGIQEIQMAGQPWVPLVTIDGAVRSVNARASRVAVGVSGAEGLVVEVSPSTKIIKGNSESHLSVMHHSLLH